MKTRCLLFLLLFCTFSALTGCKNGGVKYKIGVSQCNQHDWREQITEEMAQEVPFYNEMDIEFKIAHSNDSLQLAHLEEFIKQRVDLIIVIPREAYMLTNVIEKAYDKGIKIIVIDNKIPTEKYSAFIGVDNYKMGTIVGKNISRLLPSGGKMVEIMGNITAEVVCQRHGGLVSAEGLSSNIELVSSVDAQWNDSLAFALTDSLLRVHADIDLIFAHNDAMAHHAYMAAEKLQLHQKIKVVGIDGLAGENRGLDLVSRGVLEMSFIYPTFGNIVLQRASQILNNQPYPKETRLESSVIDRAAAKVELLKAAQLQELTLRIENLKESAYKRNWSGKVGVLFAIISLLVACGVVAIVRYSAPKIEGIKLSEQQQTDQIPLREGLAVQEAQFLDRFNAYLEENLSNPELDIDQMSAQMCYSRAQLHRKIKAQTGESPIKLLRKARLERGQQLLKTTPLTISEVAYEVGFTSPSYFTKSYKEHFGVTPSSLAK